MTPLDTQLIDSYTGAINVPLASQAGANVRADAAGTNLEYVTPQVTVGTATWDGSSELVLVGGAGARVFTLTIGAFLGQQVHVIDANGNAGSGNITVTPSGCTILGSASLTGNGDSRQYIYVSAGKWNRTNG